MVSPEKLIKQSQVFRRLSSLSKKTEYSKNYNKDIIAQEYQQLEKKRKPKIEKAKSKTQQVTPEFLDKLIGLYERKNTTQKDRMYILLELILFSL